MSDAWSIITRHATVTMAKIMWLHAWPRHYQMTTSIVG